MAHPRGPYVASALIQLALAPLFVHDWDGFVFVRSARDLLGGLTPYAAAEAGLSYIYMTWSWPPLNTWYAYPPLPLLVMTPFVFAADALGGAPWLMRVAFKIPFILGVLALAAVGALLLRAWGRPDGARAFEKAVLLNPFLIFVTAVWGMFDVWVAVSLVVTLLLLERRLFGWAGAALAVGALFKLFPVFVGPALALVAWRRGSRGVRDALRFVAAAAVTFLAVSVPFFVANPQGFVGQVVGLHAARPPQGLSVFVLPYEVGSALGVTTTAAAAESAVLGFLPLALLLVAIIVLTVASTRARTGPDVAVSLLALVVGVLLVNKVMNEQYLVMPIALLALVAFATGSDAFLNGYRVATRGALVAGLLMGWHVFTFFPPDVADVVFRAHPGAVVEQVRITLGILPHHFRAIPFFLSFAALVPFLVFSVSLIAREASVAARWARAWVDAPIGRRRRAGRALRSAGLACILVLPLAAPAAVSAWQDAPLDERAPLPSDDARVGAFYYLWWSNPSHDPGLLYGDWRKGVSQTPLDGYFSMNAAKVRSDFATMRENGVDLVLLSYHDYELGYIPTVLEAAYEAGILVAPLLELEEVYASPAHQNVDAEGQPLGRDAGFAMTDATRGAIVEYSSRALALFDDAPAAYRPGGELAVFYFDSYFSGYDARPEFQERLVAAADARLAASGDPERPTVDELRDALPADLDAFRTPGPLSAVWHDAYAELYKDFWRGALADLESRHGPLFAVSGETWNGEAPSYHGVRIAIEGQDVFDASYVYSPSFVWVFHRDDAYEENLARWQERMTLAAQHARGRGQPVIATVAAAYDDRPLRGERGFVIPPEAPDGTSTYDALWRIALDARPDIVLVATFNEFFEGTGIEPTEEFGDSLLAETKQWAARVDAARADAELRGLVVTGEPHVLFAQPNASVVTPLVSRAAQLGAVSALPAIEWSAIDASAWHAALPGLGAFDVIVWQGPESPPVDVTRALAAFVERGGRLVVLGGAHTSMPPLWGADATALLGNASGVRVGDEVVRLAPTPAIRVAIEATNVTTVFTFVGGDAHEAPAAWSYRMGRGAVVASAFDVGAAHDVEYLLCLVFDAFPDWSAPCASRLE